MHGAQPAPILAFSDANHIDAVHVDAVHVDAAIRTEAMDGDTMVRRQLPAIIWIALAWLAGMIVLEFTAIGGEPGHRQLDTRSDSFLGFYKNAAAIPSSLSGREMDSAIAGAQIDASLPARKVGPQSTLAIAQLTLGVDATLGVDGVIDRVEKPSIVRVAPQLLVVPSDQAVIQQTSSANTQ